MIQRFILRSSSFLPPNGDVSFVIPSPDPGPRPPPFHHTQSEITDPTSHESIAAWQTGQPLSRMHGSCPWPAPERVISLHLHPGVPVSKVASMVEGPLSWGVLSTLPTSFKATASPSQGSWATVMFKDP